MRDEAGVGASEATGNSLLIDKTFFFLISYIFYNFSESYSVTKKTSNSHKNMKKMLVRLYHLWKV